MRIVLHIGAHKTASTHLQLALDRSRADLAAQGVALLLPESLRRNGLRLGDFLSIQPEDRSHGAAIRKAFLQAARGADCLLISEENILGNAHQSAMMREARLYPSASVRLTRLRKVLPEAPLTVAMALRDQADFLVSAYSQRLMSGQIQPFEAFLAGLDPAALSWHDLLCRVRAALSGADCVLWTQEGYPANAPAALAAMLDTRAAASVRLGPGRAHPGLSARAHAALMAEAETLSAKGEEATRARVRQLRQQHARSKGFPPLKLFDTEASARAALAYRADLERIAALPGVTLLRKG